MSLYVAEIYKKPTKKEIYIFSDPLCCIFVKTKSSERIIPPTTRRPHDMDCFWTLMTYLGLRHEVHGNQRWNPFILKIFNKPWKALFGIVVIVAVLFVFFLVISNNVMYPNPKLEDPLIQNNQTTKRPNDQTTERLNDQTTK